MFAFSSEYSEVHDHSYLCESKLQSLSGCPKSSHFCLYDGWVHCSNEAWLLLELMVTGKRQSLFNEGQFYGGLECQSRDVAFHFFIWWRGPVQRQCLVLQGCLVFFLITKKVGAVSCTNFNHFRYFGLLPKCNESGVCKFVYFYGQISDQIGKSNLWPCTDGVRLSCLSILRNWGLTGCILTSRKCL